MPTYSTTASLSESQHTRSGRALVATAITIPLLLVVAYFAPFPSVQNDRQLNLADGSTRTIRTYVGLVSRSIQPHPPRWTSIGPDSWIDTGGNTTNLAGRTCSVGCNIYTGGFSSSLFGIDWYIEERGLSQAQADKIFSQARDLFEANEATGSPLWVSSDENYRTLKAEYPDESGSMTSVTLFSIEEF
ncbi:MAG: hypothetical protein ACF8Q5_02200 [Phycisphaerales bacterium JB040]